MRTALRRMGFDPDNLDIEEFVKFSENDPFSLLELGVVGVGAPPISTPILSINGGRDPVSSLDDMQLVVDATTNGEVWILGLDAHCAPNHTKTIYPQMINWLDEKLNEDFGD